MRYIMMGFDQDAGVRQYAFQGIADETRTDFTVGVELALTPRYGIRIQELPLLCRKLLERQGEGEEKRTFTFTEKEMRVHAEICATAREAAAQKRKSTRRPPPANVGAAWRLTAIVRPSAVRSEAQPGLLSASGLIIHRALSPAREEGVSRQPIWKQPGSENVREIVVAAVNDQRDILCELFLRALRVIDAAIMRKIGTSKDRRGAGLTSGRITMRGWPP